jgi:putative SOS response-associated peptidase YedK
MPVILPEAVHEAWLSGEAGNEILTPYPADEMTAWPISTRVNSPRNNDTAVIEVVVKIEV